MIDTLAYALGGRAAEELVFHEPTTGAGNDIEKATALARAMITQYGMSSKLGAVKYGTSGDEPFLGRNMGHERDYSDSVAAEIDAEMRALIELAHDEAWEILVEYRDVLDNIVLELMEKETISTADMARICARVVKRPPMAPYNGFGKRQPSTEPPVLTPAEKETLKAQAEADGARPVRPASGGEPERQHDSDGHGTEHRRRRRRARRRPWAGRRRHRARRRRRTRLPRRPAGQRQAHRRAGRADRRPGADREGGPRDPHRGRRGPGPGRPAADPGPGRPRLRRALRRPAGRPGAGARPPRSRPTTRSWCWSATST